MSDEDTDFENGPKALREAYDKQKAEFAALQKELAELRNERRSNTLTSTLKAKGLDDAKAAKVAGFYTGDDTSEGAVGQWLEQNADVFGLQVQQPDAPAAPTADPNAAAAQRLLGATFDQVTPAAKVDGKVLGSPEEVKSQVEKLPWEDLVKMYGFPAERPGARG